MKKETSVTKQRKTKLSKKNCEELISIIMRKDEVERKNNAVIKQLKDELAQQELMYNKLESQIKDERRVCEETAENAAKIANDKELQYLTINQLSDECEVLKQSNHYKKYVIAILIGIVIIEAIWALF